MRILGLYRHADHVCFRYRMQAFRPYLERAGHEVRFRGWPRWWLFDARFFEELQAADLVIVQRRLLSDWQLHSVRQAARVLAFDFDDAVFLRDSCARRGQASERRRRGFARMVQAADVVVAGNAFLRARALEWTSPDRVRLVPTCLDLARYQRAVHVPGRQGANLVWIGSRSTLQGLAKIGNWLDLLGQRIAGLNLKVICDQSLELAHLPVVFSPWSQTTEARELAKADIGISWLPSDAWSQGKCGLKVLQYMAAGLPVVANPVGVQADLIRHGETGFLVKTPAEWESAIRQLASDPGLRKRMGARARNLAGREFHVTQGAAAWLDILETFRHAGLAAFPRDLMLPPPLVEVSAGGFRWWIDPQHRDILIGPDGLRLEQWLQCGQARVVKKGPHRIVYRVELPEIRFYVKRNLLADRSGWIRQLIRPSKARMEYERARGVAQRGLPTYQPLALGEQISLLGAGESILITQSLEEAQELHVFAVNRLAKLPAARQAKLRQRLASDLARLVARMHDAGVRHDDLYPANILVRLEEDDQLSLFLIDLNAVRLGSPLSWKQSRQNLVILNRWFVLRASRSDRNRFWKAYCQERRHQGEGCAHLSTRQGLDLADDVEIQTWTSNLEFWRHRDKRCLKSNRYYRRLRSPGVAGHAVVDLDEAFLRTLQADPDEPFRMPGVKILKNSPSSTVAELNLVIEGRPHALIYKRFQQTAWTDPWAAMLRPTPALRSWVQGQGFRERGLPTARPLAVLQRRRFGLCGTGYLLTEKIDNAQDLHEFLENLDRRPGGHKQTLLRGQIAQVATVLRELHRRCLSHRDLKAANVLVSRDNSNFCSPFSDRAWTTGPNLLPIFATSVWLIDLVGVRRYRRLSQARRVQNLARLNASFPAHGSLTRTDRLRFLRTYLRWNLHGKDDWKSWWQAVDRATQAKIRRNHKRGRELA